MGAFPSGQRGQTVNLLSLTSVVRIHPLPPNKEAGHRPASLFGENGCRESLNARAKGASSKHKINRARLPSRLRLGMWSRIHPLPPEKSTCESKCFFQRNPPAAEEIHLRWMKSLRDEIPLCGEMEADFISSEAARRRFHPSSARISSCEARFHYDFGGPNPPAPTNTCGLNNCNPKTARVSSGFPVFIPKIIARFSCM